MARMRSLRPDYFLREDMAEVSLEAHFLLAGLAVLADRDGRLLDRPRTIEAQVFPFRDVDLEAALGELVTAGVIARYKVAGKGVIALLTFHEDQTPHPKETSLGLPPPPANSNSTVEFHGTTQPSGKVHQASGSLAEPSGRDPLGLGVGCGSRDGSGSKMGYLPASQAAGAADAGEDLPDATADAVEVPEAQRPVSDTVRPALVLAPCPDGEDEPAEKKTRKPSKAESLYFGLEEDREGACKAAGVPFIPLAWAPARINKQLGTMARAVGPDAAALNAAFEAFLDDPRGANFNPPWDLGMFIARLAEYKSKAMRANGGAP